MASKPGILTEWPWTPLGNFKYVVLAPWVIHATYTFIMAKDSSERDLGLFLIFPLLLIRMLHNQIWISFSRYRVAKGKARIVDKSIEFDQVDRERNWDDQIIFNGILFYLGREYIKKAHNIPIWRADGVVMTALIHAGPVEFLYYWLHRALHHHFLYSRYHSHHHSSIATEPITSVIHPFAEHIAYFGLFAIPLLATIITGTASIVSFGIYIIYIDVMNNMGHCNFEIVPTRLFSVFPLLKYLMYTPSFHSLHHTQFRTNYSLFMPFYDLIFNTMDVSSEKLHDISLKKEAESPDVVYLTHLTTPESIFHLRLGFASFASKPQTSSKCYIWLMWPLTLASVFIINCLNHRTFLLERNVFHNLKLQTWVIPKYTIQYLTQWQRETINNLIEEAILEAEDKGIKVVSLGLRNQEEELNNNGELYIRRYPDLKVKVVDGSSLAVAVVLHSIPKGTTQVVLTGNVSKVAYAISLALCQDGIQVAMVRENEYKWLKSRFNAEAGNNLLMLSKNNASKIWLVGDGLSEEEQIRALKGTVFIPFSQFPPKKMRKDCSYFTTPSLLTPKHLHNVDSCENWLERRVMSAWRVAGILHGLEGWNVHECGNMMFDVDKIWQATLHHGFRPINLPNRNI